MYQPSDVLLIPFPFTDLSATKKRPVLVLTSVNSYGGFIGLQITSKQGYQESVQIGKHDFAVGTLPIISFIRTDKIFTLNRSIVFYRVGKITENAFKRVEDSLCGFLC